MCSDTKFPLAALYEICHPTDIRANPCYSLFCYFTEDALTLTVVSVVINIMFNVRKLIIEMALRPQCNVNGLWFMKLS